jgi:hypothetical protein
MDQTRFDELARGLASGATRRRLVQGAAVALAGGIGLTAAGGVFARKGKQGLRAQSTGKGKGKGQEKVELCHKPGTADQEEIVVAQPAVQAHLKHGDSEGVCPCSRPSPGISTCCNGADACGATHGRECGTDASGTLCFCGSTLAGRGGCFLGDLNNCQRAKCTDDRDCDTDEACVAAPCCGAEGVCIPFCVAATA